MMGVSYTSGSAECVETKCEAAALRGRLLI